MNTLTPPPPARLIGFINPNNQQRMNLKPFLEFLKRYGQHDANEAANVIEFTANKEDESNPELDLSMSTDLLRDLATCLRQMTK